MTLMDGFESLEASTAALKARALMLAKYRAPLSPYHDFPDLAAEFDCFNGDKKRSGVSAPRVQATCVSVAVVCIHFCPCVAILLWAVNHPGTSVTNDQKLSL